MQVKTQLSQTKVESCLSGLSLSLSPRSFGESRRVTTEPTLRNEQEWLTPRDRCRRSCRGSGCR